MHGAKRRIPPADVRRKDDKRVSLFLAERLQRTARSSGAEYAPRSLLLAVSLYEILAQDAERHAWLQRSEILGDTVDIHLMPVKTFQHTVEGVCTECVAGVDDFHTVFRRDSFDYHARGVVRAANADKHKCIGLFSNLRRQCLNALQLL